MEGVKASLTTDLVGDNNNLVFTAVDGGVAGNSISVTYVDPQAAWGELTVSVDGTDITVSLSTDGDGIIVATANHVLNAVNTHLGASALVVATNINSDPLTGVGVVTAMPKTFLTGGEDPA